MSRAKKFGTVYFRDRILFQGNGANGRDPLYLMISEGVNNFGKRMVQSVVGLLVSSLSFLRPSFQSTF